MVTPRTGLASIPDAAAELDLSKGKVYLMVQRGEIPHRRYGRSVRIPWSWIHAQAACDTNGQDASEVAQ